MNMGETKYNFAKIEKKWQKKWEQEGIFEAEPDSKKEKFFFTTPYPYISGSLHLGHGRVVAESDIYCRYLRMKGKNVLFPLAFHITGTPVLGISAAIASGDKKKVKMYEEYVSAYELDKKKTKEIVKSFVDPQKIVDFFIPKMVEEYKQLGLGIDWRRSFTSGDKEHQEMVTWQFKKYKEKKYLTQGKYPVLYSPKDQSAMGEDDIQDGDSDPVEKQDFIWVKFKMKNSDLILMAGTTRPDALYGQTHLWVDPNGKYVVVQVGDEKWVVGKEVVEKIKYQYKDFKIIRDIKPKELMGKWARGPLVDYDTYIVPAWFIDSSVGSGIVYSALEDPVDLFELKKIHSNMKMLDEYHLDKKVIAKLKPIPIISVSGMGDNLGEEIGKEFGIKSPDEKEKVELAKNELNKRVFRKGVMQNNCGKCSGMSVPACQDYLKKKLVEEGEAIMFYELSREAFSRSGGKIVVAVLDDQWFLNFNAEGWKKKAYGCLKQVELSSEAKRKQFEDNFEWLDKRPCARKRGLGTKFPFNDEWIIESLSDSTVYMTLYTINHIIQRNKLKRENLNDAFFDYVYLGKGNINKVVKDTGVKKSVLEECRKSFEYWIPIDHRHTFVLHLSNHLSFMLFAFAGLFPKKDWPKKISFHGLVVREGTKMSKSKGNVITLLEVKEKYGADVFRFYLTQSTNLEGTFDWTEKGVKNAMATINKIYSSLNEVAESRKKAKVRDLYVSKFNHLVKQATERVEKMELRKYNICVVYDMLNLLKDAKSVMKRDELEGFYDLILESWLKLLSPVIPHITEEVWEKIGGKGFISLAEWPKFDEKKIVE